MDDDSDQEHSDASPASSSKPSFPSYPPGDHRLQSAYCLWFSRKTGGKQAQAAFDQQLRKIGSFATCEQFWDLNGHLVSPGEMQSHSDFHLFKEGIKPMWEVRLKRNIS
jgi:translation initiation factor 4E